AGSLRPAFCFARGSSARFLHSFYNGQLGSRKNESVAHSRSFSEAHFYFLMEVRIEFGHRLRHVRHPEVVDVLQTASTAKPCLAETLESVKAHSFLIHSHLDEARSKPTIL